MATKKRFLGPASFPLREPTSNSKSNGRVMNPPRFNELTASDVRKPGFKNSATLGKPGDVTSAN